ncbi:PP2C family protein-serine/threonine phosphatase [Dactylosporangium siamense]|uniref:PPM-type phosphatase domain-containing protein n=1 Tax=Dactylosporangium siamense TaxID=685454 RepID=A0A919PZL9_9ACTN|nr:PP2C family protein-serine/threonine phosphatase [Dactylosporangium siamense]GIG51623.1 hypothetical protein Dsi01nite_096640 [Dactylosporangium siamense]
MRYINAGHPPPLLIRHGKVARSLGGGWRMPLGVDDPQIEVAEESLERGDRLLLYTDGVTETRDQRGGMLTDAGLVDLVERDAGQLPAPEALRRLCHAALARYDGPPADEVTLMLRARDGTPAPPGNRAFGGRVLTGPMSAVGAASTRSPVPASCAI